MNNFSFTFPETPNSFKQAVHNSVENNLNQKSSITLKDNDNKSITNNIRNKSFKFLKVASFVLIICGTIYFIESSVVNDQFVIDDNQVEKPFTSETMIENTSDRIISIPEQTIEIDNRTTAYVINSTISPSGIVLNIQFTTTSEYSNESSRNYNSTNYYIEDSSGNRKLLIGYPGDAAKSVKLGINWSANIDDFDINSDYIKMIPYTIDTNRYIPGKEIIDEEHAFIIKLK